MCVYVCVHVCVCVCVIAAKQNQVLITNINELELLGMSVIGFVFTFLAGGRVFWEWTIALVFRLPFSFHLK